MKLKEYKRDEFIELEAIYDTWNNKTQLISLKKSEILQFYETVTNLNVLCTLVVTKHGNFKSTIGYNQLKEEIGL